MARFDCAASACLTLSVVLDGFDAKFDGRTMFSVEGVDEEVESSLLLLEEPPPKKPPKAILLVLLRLVITSWRY